MNDEAARPTDGPAQVTGMDREVNDRPATPAARPVASGGANPVRGHVSARDGGRARLRWAVASIVTLVVLAVSMAGFMILSAGAATSALVGYVPPGSVGYLEIRLDAPGDQRQNAANLLAHFPGFADQSNLGMKLDEALDQLVGRGTGGTQSFTGNIKSWLGDSVAIAMTRMPEASVGASGLTAQASAGLLLVAVRDPAGARTWADATFGPGSGSSTYGGVALTSIARHGKTLEYGVVANVLVAGDPQSVRAAIDSRGASTFPDGAAFKAAAAAIPGDRIAFGFLDLREVAQAVDAQRSAAAAATALALQQLPAWVAVTVRAESDAVTATLALPDTNLAPVAANHSSVLAAKLPATTVAALELHDVAGLLGSVMTTLRASPDTAGRSSQVDQALQAIGGIDSLVGWMGDATLAVMPASDGVHFAVGMLIAAKDADAAETRLIQLKNLVALVGSSTGITLRDETYNGTTISVLDLSVLRPLVPPQVLAQVAPGDGLSLAVAQMGDVVIAGIGDTFVKAALDGGTANLAQQEGYRAALERAGASNTGQLYVDLNGIIGTVAGQLPPDEFRHYQSDIKPYLDPFRALAASGSAGDPNRARIVITVK